MEAYYYRKYGQSKGVGGLAYEEVGMRLGFGKLLRKGRTFSSAILLLS